ncbi:DUF2653 family protein [Effusibacillus dendaii]|uniref:DUF2653 family protein n=1 Tax=Effusibacillus dendaii TaxID=2743772 RepID=A0A7I8DCU6_9BACL|nr:DUF2653 family protein [Effusibacillus dendaii]BCJ87102.1 hypothetical protein skT53_20870 [Effusibacillus dendaii]
MKILFDEQDLIDSVCVLTAMRHNRPVESLQAELFYEEQKGFSALVTAQNGLYRYDLTEQDLIDSVAVYLSEYHQFDPQKLTVELLFEENNGFSAYVNRM